jgi:peptidoglycan hydrolase-like protein with peptidoglycan-binding domain
MSPEQTRWLLGVSVAVVGGIWANALILQSTWPAGGAAVPSRPLAGVPVRKSAAAQPELAAVHLGHVSAPIAGIAQAPDQAPATEPNVTDLIDTLRLELLRLGYGPIARAASPGLQLRAAILAFEYDHGLPLTAEPSDTLLAIASGSAPAQRFSTPEARQVVGPQAERTLHIVQTMLTTLGFLGGAADDNTREATAAAIRRFETKHNLPVTGRVSALLMTRLVAATGARAAAER